MPELSYSRGPHLALRAETIFEARSRMARRLPAHEALVVRHQNARLTYRELKERVEETARGPRPRVRRAHRGMGQQLRRVGSPFPRLRAHRNGSGERQPSGKVQNSSSANRKSLSGVSRRLPASEPRERAVSAKARVCTDERLPLPQGR